MIIELMHAITHKPLLSTCRLWKGITPLWGRQIPYTMMKFGKLRSSWCGPARIMHSLLADVGLLIVCSVL